ncbi:TPA: Fur-regulated protein [Escherichia coli]
MTNIYNINFGARSDEPAQNQVTISADKFEVNSGVDTNLEAVLGNSLKNAAECAALDVAKQMAADKKAMDELTSHVRKAIMMECFPGGVIWQQCRR